MKRNLMKMGSILCAGLASAGTLTWNGTVDDCWDMFTQDWLDEASSPVEWADGSVAMFKTAGVVLLFGELSPAAMTFDAAASSVTLSEGVITTDAITANNKLTAIDSVLIATNDLTITGNGIGSRYFSGVLTANNQVLFRNLSIADVKMFTADMGTGSSARRTYSMTPFFVETNATTWTAQFQDFEGDYTKCVKAQFTQSGSDIVGKILFARYYGAEGIDAMGSDFSDISSSGGYNLQHIRAITDESDLPRVELTRGVTVGGTLTVGEGRVRLDGVVTNAIVNNGAIVGSPDGWTVLSGKISGTGTIICPAATVKDRTVVAEDTGYVPTAATVFFKNAEIRQIISAGGQMGGSSVTGGLASYECKPWFCYNDGRAVYVQLQFFDPDTANPVMRCVKIKFTQTGDDVAAQAVGAAVIGCPNGQPRYGLNFDNTSYADPVATSDSDSSYGIHNLSITLGQRMALGNTHDAYVANTFTGGVIVNGTLVTRQFGSLPFVGCDITVNDGGNLILGSPHLNWNGAGGSWNQILVNRGGTLTIEASFLGGTARPIVLNGGTLSLPLYSDDNGDCWNYMDRIFLSNGAKIIGNPVRVGPGGAGVTSAYMRVSGDTPSSVESGIVLAGRNREPNWSLTFDVADVTGDAKPDLLVPSSIKDYIEFSTNPVVVLAGMHVAKAGPGTVSLSGDNTYIGVTEVSAGTLALDSSHALSTNAVAMTGGTLAVNADGIAAGGISVTNASVTVNGADFSAGDISLCAGTLTLAAPGTAVGALTLTGNAAVELGDGAEISFADSSGMAWANDAMLTVTGQLGETTVRFGTDATGLTKAQLGQIRCNGHRVFLDANGYLRCPPRQLFIRLQ